MASKKKTKTKKFPKVARISKKADKLLKSCSVCDKRGHNARSHKRGAAKFKEVA